MATNEELAAGDLWEKSTGWLRHKVSSWPMKPVGQWPPQFGIPEDQWVEAFRRRSAQKFVEQLKQGAEGRTSTRKVENHRHQLQCLEFRATSSPNRRLRKKQTSPTSVLTWARRTSKCWQMQVLTTAEQDWPTCLQSGEVGNSLSVFHSWVANNHQLRKVYIYICPNWSNCHDFSGSWLTFWER